MHNKISIIIPVYNKGKYIERCIKSVENQKYNNVEIILVDDGSTDNSGQLCDLHAKLNGNIKVIHQENRGVSEARNNGIKFATGDYIMFADADDYLDPNMVEVLYKTVTNNQAELAICGYRMLTNGTVKEVKENNGVYTLKEFIKLIVKWKANPLIGSPCNKIIRRELITDYNIKFYKDVIYAEDFDFILRVLLHIKKVAVTNECLYSYDLDVPNSLTKINTLNANELWINQRRIIEDCENLQTVAAIEDELPGQLFAEAIALNFSRRVFIGDKNDYKLWINELTEKEQYSKYLRITKRIYNNNLENVTYKVLRLAIMMKIDTILFYIGRPIVRKYYKYVLGDKNENSNISGGNE
ncbi:glycosyltransferase family 2 protein [Pseudobutyrivibrio sp. LB2011]|uniref:glycosyltransferase family 2 protein n=1 Tax=Pseudobutyrivibrio sp. LB2011 TaxID=1408312 RepID=UPI00067931FE|nr:glycosyltransferase family 2 protein [Pseudobutyrivibrio sp. LB2011]